MKSLPLLCLVLLTSIARADDAVRIEKNTAYLPAERKEKADLYLPTEDGQKHPAVVIIHGGGWNGGVKNGGREINIGTTLASHGYVGMSIDYQLNDRTSPTLCWPQNLHDCKTAVRWLRANAERLHIDTAHIGVIGGSAGAHLASMVAITGPECGLDPAAPYGEQSCRVNCVVEMYGPADIVNFKDISALRKTRAEAPELYKQFSILTHLDKSDPPFLILHGTADKTVDVEQARILDAALTKHGIEHQLEIVEGAPHSFHFQPKEKDLRPLALAFFDKHLKSAVK